MTFEALETSVDDGRPVELMQVAYLTNHWYYSTADEPVIYGGITYLPMPMKHGSIAPAGDVAKSQLTISVPQDCPVGELFRIQPPSGVVSVTLFATHVDEVEMKAIWKGRIVNAEWVEPWLHLMTENVYSSMQRLGLRRKFGAPCPHNLYSIGHGLCNVVKEAFAQGHLVTSVDGVTIHCETAVGAADNLFAGGYVTWVNVHTGYLEKRMVISSDQVGNLVLNVQPFGLVAGAAITAYPGCDHTPEACERFGNSLNYGGWLFIPKKNPFGGSTLY